METTTGDASRWRKSSRCVVDNCLEISLRGERVLLRSSSDPDGVILECSAREWDEFALAVRRGEFGLTQEG